MTKTQPNLDEYETCITVGVGNLSSVRLWFYNNGVLEKSRPKYVPLEWNVTERLESTIMIKWFVVVGVKKNENKAKIQMEETSCSYLENLSISSA